MQSHPWKTIWLFGFVLLILLMISVGGITRMTRSGLSITEWRLVTGVLPPLSPSAWQQSFKLYQKTPEFLQINSHFTLEDYKKIFFWEYFHRLLGRFIFLFVTIPGVLLWRRKIIAGRLVLQLGVLVALQGLLGWLMVKTGLNHKPHVSPLMLALHFFAALGVLVAGARPLMQVRSELEAIRVPSRGPLKGLWISSGIVLSLQIFYGCLTSGLKAGFAFNTYPWMGSSFLPPGGLALTPVWINVIENPTTVQWIHRWLGLLAFILILGTAQVFNRQVPAARRPFLWLVLLLALQMALGILNLLWGVPIVLAAAHQIVAALIVLAYFRIGYRLVFSQKLV